jgi:hypothetical protein
MHTRELNMLCILRIRVYRIIEYIVTILRGAGSSTKYMDNTQGGPSPPVILWYAFIDNT